MDLFDRHLGLILRYMKANPATVLIVAASMGQGPIRYRHLGRTFVVERPETLLAELELPAAEVGLAMYPRFRSSSTTRLPLAKRPRGWSR